MSWIGQMFCKHQIEAKDHRVRRLTECGGYIYTIEQVITIIFCKKCGYSKKIVV